MKQEMETRYRVVPRERNRGRDRDCPVAPKFLRASTVLLSLALPDCTGHSSVPFPYTCLFSLQFEQVSVFRSQGTELEKVREAQL